MAPLYTREPPSPRDCVRRTIVQVRRPSRQPTLTCRGLEGRASRSPCGPTSLERVTGLIPSARQSADTEVSRCAIATWASRTWVFDSANVPPPWRPRARAAVSPARVRSRISSARPRPAPRPAAVVVSICAPCPVSTRRPTPRVDRSCTVLTRWGEAAAEAVELPDDDHGARPARAQAAVEPRRGRRTRTVVVDVDGGRRPRPAARRATGPATGSRPPVRRERRRSACVVNGRLRHTVEGAVRRAPPRAVSRV